MFGARVGDMLVGLAVGYGVSMKVGKSFFSTRRETE